MDSFVANHILAILMEGSSFSQGGGAIYQGSRTKLNRGRIY